MNRHIRQFLSQRILSPVMGLLKQGMTPDALAKSIAAGLTIAVFPIFGITSLICIAVAALFRLNQIAIQIGNYCAYPLQFILFIPFLRFGEYLFGLETVPILPTEMFALARDNFSQFAELYGVAVLSACVAWALIALPVYLVAWQALSLMLRKLPLKRLSDESQ